MTAWREEWGIDLATLSLQSALDGGGWSTPCTGETLVAKFAQ